MALNVLGPTLLASVLSAAFDLAAFALVAGIMLLVRKDVDAAEHKVQDDAYHALAVYFLRFAFCLRLPSAFPAASRSNVTSVSMVQCSGW